MSAEMVRATLNGQWVIVLPKHRAERPEWFTTAGWEKARLQALHDEVKRQSHSYLMLRGGPHQADSTRAVVYYIGSEEAEMTALCQQWGAEVVMFEPNPLVWPNARSIWEANEMHPPLGIFVGFASNITDENPPHRAFGAEGVVKPREWPSSAYGEVIGNHGFKELYQEADAFPQIKIDDYVGRTGIVPTIITFDCEGSDWQVMRGAEQTLRDHKPVIFASIHPEFMFHQYGEYSRDFRNWMIGLGYEETILDYQHELHTLYTPKELA